MSLIELAKESADLDVKRRIQDILRCYRNSWDVYAELLQNSVDAINRRQKIIETVNADVVADNDYVGKILIEIYPTSKRVLICDNGTGIRKEKIQSMLLPEGTDKRPGEEYGYKGKGLTYAVFASKSFDIITRYYESEKAYEMSLSSLFEWTIDNDNSIPFPSGPIPEVTEKEIDEKYKDFNTLIRVDLEDDYKERYAALSSLDQAFLLIEEEKYEAFETLLRTRTAVGNTRVLFNETPITNIEINLRVVDNDGNYIYNVQVPYEFAHPKDNNTIKSRSYSFQEYVKEICVKAGSNKDFYCLTNYYPKATIGERNPLTADICLSAIYRGTISDINQSIGMEGLYAPGVYLSIMGMPTGIKIADWSLDRGGAAYQRYYAVVDCGLSIGEELDSGRKGITAYRANQISDFVFERLSDKIDDSDKFSTFAVRNLTATSDDKDLDELFDEDVDDFSKRIEHIKEIIEADKDRPITKFIKKNTTLLHEPTNEEEVRTLFHEMLACKYIKGYTTIFDAANRSTYDSAMDYQLVVSDEVSANSDPNGISQIVIEKSKKKGVSVINNVQWGRLVKHSGDKALCVEYKYLLGDLLNDLLKKDSSKDPEKIDIVIAWDDSDLGKYTERCVFTNMDPNKTVFYGATSELCVTSPRPAKMICICLKKVIERIIYKAN